MALKKTVQLSMLGDVPDEVVSRSYDFSGKRMVARILHLGAAVLLGPLYDLKREIA